MALAAGGCAQSASTGDTGFPDGGIDAASDAAAPPPSDAGVSDVGMFSNDGGGEAGPVSTNYFILVSQTPAGSAPQSTWGGISRYDVPADHMPANMATAIPAADVADPIGLAFRQTSAEVFVGNRRGMTTGSISRFFYDAKTKTFTKNGSDLLMTDTAGAVMQLAFSPDEKELFVARDGSAITRMSLDAKGNLSASGAITSGLGRMIGVAVSKDGQRLYATQQYSAKIWQFDLPAGTEHTPEFDVPGAQRPHLMVMDRQHALLYVCDIQASVVFVLAVDANDDLSLQQTIPATNAISTAISPDFQELFVTSHNSTPPDVINRFEADGGGWGSEGPAAAISTTTSLGGTLVFAASAVPMPPQ